MKKRFTLLCFSLLIQMLHAQSFRFSISGGYCVPIASTMNFSSYSQIQVPGYSNVYATTSGTLQRSSFGQGGCVGIALQWFSKKDIGVGLRLSANFGSAQKSSLAVSDTFGNRTNVDFTDHLFSFQFIPHVAFRHDFRVVSPVVELGMVIGANNIRQTYTEQNKFISSTTNEHGGVMLGFYSSLALAFHLSPKVDMTVGLHCVAASYSPTEWTRIDYYYAGHNYIGQLSPADIQGSYTNNYQAGNHQRSSFTIACSNVGFTTGFTFKLGGAKKQEKAKKVKYEDNY
jgi:hypothetical protein